MTQLPSNDFSGISRTSLSPKPLSGESLCVWQLHLPNRNQLVTPQSNGRSLSNKIKLAVYGNRIWCTSKCGRENVKTLKGEYRSYLHDTGVKAAFLACKYHELQRSLINLTTLKLIKTQNSLVLNKYTPLTKQSGKSQTGRRYFQHKPLPLAWCYVPAGVQMHVIGTSLPHFLTYQLLWRLYWMTPTVGLNEYLVHCRESGLSVL